MTSVSEFLADLHARGVKVWAEEGRLRYRSPAGVVTPGIREELARRKDEILRLKRWCGPEVGLGPREGDARLSVARLSFAQQRLWFLEQMNPGNASYNFHTAMGLEGPLDVAVLRRVFGEIVGRHESLRTTFASSAGEPRAVVHGAPDWRLPVTDLRTVEEGSRRSLAGRLAREEAERPFDLGAGPLVRTSLLQLDDQRYVLLVTMHHIVCDRWSVAVLVREAGAIYRALAGGLGAPLEPLRIQYADFAEWQKTHSGDGDSRESIEYWRRQLAGVSTLCLPSDHPRPAVQSFAGASVRFELSVSESDALRDLSRRQGATLFMVLAAAFQLLLARYSGQDDIAIGVPVANRFVTEIEPLIGLFVNTLVLRSDLSGNPTFVELLERVRRVALDAFDHQSVPFERLVDELRIVRDPSRSPVFQVMFMLQEPYEDELDFPGIAAAHFPVDTGVAKFDLTLEVTNTPALKGVLEYNTDLYDEATVVRMLDHWRNLLSGIAADPKRRIGDVPLVSGEERDSIVGLASGARVAIPEAPWVHSMFENQAERTPEAPAAIANGSGISYATLNQRANRLAWQLRGLGVRAETRVGILLKRSANMLIALLAVHKAGGAFVPLEPTLPSERLAFLLRDGAVGLVLSDTTFRDRLPSGDLKIVALDELEPAFEGYPESNLLPVATGQNLAYVLYTSGSTGQPKGVEITHYGLNNYLSWCASEYFGRSGSGSAVHTPLGFDLTVTSLLAPLAAGQSVTLLPESGAGRDLLELAEQEAHFRVLKLTPGHLRMLARTRVRCRADVLVVGGEALSGDDLRDLAELMPDARIVNEYGPTEAVVGCSVESFPIAEVAPGPVSIGRPIQNARLYVLDSHGDLAPVGVPGELHIGGIGVARGYLNRPGLTAERFIPDPFSDVPGSHMFRSGDLARLGADGKLEYLGRGDQQVKVRGYRVELGEIEETLRSCDGVAEALVIKVEEQLVAYVAPAEGSALDERSLHGDLTAKLPDYMVPAAFVFLEEMPLNRNGKVDRAALPEPVRRPTASPGIISNTSPLGQQIASIWREVLHLDHVDEQANFFDLGGDSLSLVKVHSRLQDLTGAAPPLIELFRNPTVEKLANLLASETSAQPAATAGNRAEHRLARLQPARKRMSANA